MDCEHEWQKAPENQLNGNAAQEICTKCGLIRQTLTVKDGGHGQSAKIQSKS